MDFYKSPTRIYVKCLKEASDQFSAFTITSNTSDPNDGDIALLESLSPKIKVSPTRSMYVFIYLPFRLY